MNSQKQIGAKLIRDLEKERGSKVIVYFTGDRPPFGSRIAEDAVRYLYEHLVNSDFDEERKVIDLFLYSRGGDVSVPWRIASMIREFCEDFNVLVPYKAQSAATLLSLGADNVIMGKKAELGPIDPTLVKATVGEGALPQQDIISVEDVNSFLSFVKERANINDQSALAEVVGTLVNQISPLTLGNVNRQNSHIRLVARKLLTSRKEKMDEEKINSIIETLTEKIYSHGHGIGRKEAKDIGLPIIIPDDKTENLIWQLYLKYENFLKLTDPIYPEIELDRDENKILENLPVAVMESVKKIHIFKANVNLKKERRVPPSPQINLNVNLQLPPSIQPDQIPQQAQQILQQLMAQISQNITQLVQQEIVRQSPIVGIGGRVYGGKWYEEK
ncbi:MAG: hypothetical protein WA977_00215 [Halobacteriota archaeon]